MEARARARFLECGDKAAAIRDLQLRLIYNPFPQLHVDFEFSSNFPRCRCGFSPQKLPPKCLSYELHERRSVSVDLLLNPDQFPALPTYTGG